MEKYKRTVSTQQMMGSHQYWNKFLLLGISSGTCILLFGAFFYISLGDPNIEVSHFEECRLAKDEQSSDRLNFFLRCMNMRPVDAPANWEPAVKPKEELQILFLGDSMIYGQGLEWNETLPFVLQEQLQTRLDSMVIRVINLGLRGANTYDEFELYATLGMFIKHDFVILFIGNNDGELGEIQNPTNTFLEKTKNRMLGSNVAWMRGLGRRVGWWRLEQARRSTSSAQLWSRIKQPLTELLALTPQKCFLIVHEFETSSEPWNGAFQHFLETHGIPTVSLSPFYSPNPLAKYILPSDGHPTAFAQAQAAGLITDYLLNSSIIQQCARA